MNSAIPVLIVRVGALRCALPASHVIETMRPLPVESVGESPDFVRGLAVIRGAPVPVVDLARLLGDGEAGPISRYVALRAGEKRVALAVEEVLELRELEVSALEELPPLLRDGAGGAVELVGALDARLLLLLRAARLVPEAAWEQWAKKGA